MSSFRFLRGQLCLVLTIGIATLLASQTNQYAEYELQIEDRLYAFELARQSADHDALMHFIYPELFTLIPRDVLLENMRRTNKVAVAITRLNGFRFAMIGTPIEANGSTFVKVQYEYIRSNNGDTARFLPAANQNDNNREKRELLAIRTDNDLQWYFLEIQRGQAELLASLVPKSMLKFK